MDGSIMCDGDIGHSGLGVHGSAPSGGGGEARGVGNRRAGNEARRAGRPSHGNPRDRSQKIARAP